MADDDNSPGKNPTASTSANRQTRSNSPDFGLSDAELNAVMQDFEMRHPEYAAEAGASGTQRSKPAVIAQKDAASDENYFDDSDWIEKQDKEFFAELDAIEERMLSNNKGSSPARKRAKQRLQPADPSIEGKDGSGLRHRAGYGDLSPELRQNIAMNLVSEDPGQTARNLRSFRLVDKGNRQAVRQKSRLSDFDAKLAEAGKLANEIFRTTYPQNGLPDRRPLRHRNGNVTEEVVDEARTISAVAPTLPFLGEKERARVVEDTLGLRDDTRRAVATLHLISQSNTLQTQQRSRLLDDALAMFSKPMENDDNLHRIAATTVVCAGLNNHLEPKHKRILAEIVATQGDKRSLYADVFAKAGGSLELGKLKESHELRNLRTSESNVGKLRGDLTTLQEKVPEDFDEHYLSVKQIGEANLKGVKEARAVLQNSGRSRDRTDHSR